MNQEKELLERIKDSFCIKKYGHHYDNADYRGLITTKDSDEISQRYASELLNLKIEAARHNDGTEPKNSDPEYWKGWHEALDYLKK